MLKHNLLISIRSFKKYKSSFLINIIGLSSGLACALFIFLWVSDEMSVDKFHENEENLYQVITNLPLDNQILTLTDSPLLLSENITKEFPEVEDAAAVGADFCIPKGIFTHGIKSQAAEGIFATENFFHVFSFELLNGSSDQVLDDKYGVVLSENLANKLFGATDKAIGQSLDWNYEWSDGGGEQKLKVSGVFKTLPKNSTLQFEYVVHSDLLIEDDSNAGDWNGHYAKSFLLLKEGTDIDDFNKKIEGYLVSKREGKFTMNSFLQKFSDRYLKNPYENGIQVGGRIEYVRLFILIALFILFIACINFMNLSTAQAGRKMKEVGVKKAVGANRRSLVIQYLSESILLSLLSLAVALLLVILFLPKFNLLTDKSIELSLGWTQILSLLTIVLFTGFLAGSYPAFRLSGFKPVEVLKGKLHTSFGEFWMRKGLVVFQFAISIIFIIGVLVVNKQIEYTQTKNLGYERDNVVRFTLGSNNERPEAFLAEIQKLSGVKNVGAMNGDFLNGLDNNGGWSWNREMNRTEVFLFQAPRLSYNAIETLGMELVAGRTFSKERNDDYDKIIINESALKLMGIENPIGKILDKGEDQQQEIIGVVKDFQYGSIHKKVEPLIIRFREFGRDVLVKISAGTEKETLAQLDDLYSKFNPGYPFDYSFLDQDYQALYKTESRVADLSNYFGVLAILISCLGLFGLAAFTAEKRAKEIGIRKILGSSVLGIVRMFSSEFLKMVLAAIFIAIPIGYWASSRWLENFGYAIDLKWWYFALAGIAALLIAMITVSWQSYRAATINPAKTLRAE